MVYLIDTEQEELNEVNVNGQFDPIIRHNQKLFEKEYPVMTVTDRKEVTCYVCDFISFKKFKPKDNDIVIPANHLYTIEEYKKIVKTHKKGLNSKRT